MSRRGAVALSIVAALFAAIAAPLTIDALRFRASTLFGLTERQARERLGEPSFARPLSDGSPDWRLPEEFERPIWSAYTADQRARLTASARFCFNYHGFAGTTHTLTFVAGRVASVESGSK